MAQKPPKGKDFVPKSNVIRPVISNSSLYYTPTDVLEGFQERIETGIDWTIAENARRHYNKICSTEEIRTVLFSEALKNKIDNSILAGFLDKESSMSLEQQWELILPITLWDNEKFSNKEGQICFKNANFITDNIVKLIKKAVRLEDRDMLWDDFKKVNILRLIDSQMTDLDKGLLEFNNLITLNLCGNFIENLDSQFLSPNLRSLELQANRIKSIEGFVEDLPYNLLYLGLARNMLKDGVEIEDFGRLPHYISVLDLSDNDIYNLEPLLDALARLPNLTSLQLAGNPCSMCTAYARTTLARLPRLMWLDNREILLSDRVNSHVEPHPDDLRSGHFIFTTIRVISAVQPPKQEKGSVALFHVELEIPLLDSFRRSFLMYRRHESLIEMLPAPEDDFYDNITSRISNINEQRVCEEQSPHESDIYKVLEEKSSRIIQNYTIFESNKVPWSKIMTFQDPILKIFCPDLVTLRNTFRSVITTTTNKPTKDKKSLHNFKAIVEQRVVLATIKCALKNPDWSQAYQHFHWDDSLGTDEAIHWGDGDLAVLQYTQTAIKNQLVSKVKQEGDKLNPASLKLTTPENLTCQFGFGLETLK